VAPLSAADFLRELRGLGARRLRSVTFRKNRNTIWSLTKNGTALNVHEAFQVASEELMRAFAVIAQEGGVGSPAAKEASVTVSEWPHLKSAIDALRTEHDDKRRTIDADETASATHCCATPEQRAYLRSLYLYFNRTRFGGALPLDVPVRLSSRMKSALGHMLPGERDGERHVVEIALNVDLLLDGNGAERVDTLLHEMAHAADYLESGHRGHGRSWREWAMRVGCAPELLYERPVRRRRRRGDTVTRVPPLPHALRRRVA
jgi:SprT-like family protein